MDAIKRHRKGRRINKDRMVKRDEKLAVSIIDGLTLRDISLFALRRQGHS